MIIRVVAFARARELLGTGAMSLELGEGATLRELQEHLLRQAPRLAELGESLRFACNGAMAVALQPLRDGDEVALLPPVSGG